MTDEDVRITPLSTEDLFREVQPIAARIARTVGQDFKGYVEVEDLHQDLMAWTLANEDRVQEYLMPVEGDMTAAGGRRKLHTAFRRIARGIAHEAKAARLGYRIEDLHFYSKATIEELLPAVLAGPEEWLDATPQEGPRPKTDPALGNGKLAMLVDVKVAYDAGSFDDRLLLEHRYADNFDVDVLAAEYDVTDVTIRRRIDRALGRIVDRLGGTRPDFGVKGRRQAMSNAEAQRLTQNQEAS